MVSTVLLSGVKRYEKDLLFWSLDSANSESIAFFDDGLFIFPCRPLGSIHSLEVRHSSCP